MEKLGHRLDNEKSNPRPKCGQIMSTSITLSFLQHCFHYSIYKVYEAYCS